MFFESDNAGPAAPEILQALKDINFGYQSSYGSDQHTKKVYSRIKDIFEAPNASIYFVTTGTAANALSLACLSKPWSKIFCHKDSHIENDECASPEFYTGGAKLSFVPGENAKISSALLKKALEKSPAGNVHSAQPGVLSITNATEYGTVYSQSEIEELCEIAAFHRVPVHLDGARFANALVNTKASPAELTWKAGIDVVSLGGTKNGLIAAEAVILFDNDKSWEFELRRKRGGHLISKHRYLTAQFEAYFQNDLWLNLAAKANEAAQTLARKISTIKNAKIEYQPQANSVFASMPRAMHKRAIENGAKYYFWPDDQTMSGLLNERLLARFVCNWSTSEVEIKNLASAFE